MVHKGSIYHSRIDNYIKNNLSVALRVKNDNDLAENIARKVRSNEEISVDESLLQHITFNETTIKVVEKLVRIDELLSKIDCDHGTASIDILDQDFNDTGGFIEITTHSHDIVDPLRDLLDEFDWENTNTSYLSEEGLIKFEMETKIENLE